MYKKLNNGVEINYPVNDGTAFRVEGFTGYFTIIDAIVVPKNHNTYVLLEHNKLGEDLTLAVEMPQTELLKLSLFDNRPMNVGLSTKKDYAIFIKSQYIISDDCAGNYLTDTLNDEDIDIEDYIQLFTDDINLIKQEN